MHEGQMKFCMHASTIIPISDWHSRDDEISRRNVMSSVQYPVSAVLPVNIPLDVRVSRSECPVRAGENRQWWASGSWEMMWAQWWLDQLSKDTGHGCAGAGGCGCWCSIASPSHQPRVSEWACGHQAVQSWVPPTLAKKDPISQVNISGHTLLWRELLVVRQCKKENMIVVGL